MASSSRVCFSSSARTFLPITRPGGSVIGGICGNRPKSLISFSMGLVARPMVRAAGQVGNDLAGSRRKLDRDARRRCAAVHAGHPAAQPRLPHRKSFHPEIER